MNLQTSYLGLSLAHPVIAGASPLSATLDGIRRLEDAGAAAIVMASLYEEELLAEEEALEAALTLGAESHSEVTRYPPPLCGCRRPQTGHVEMLRRAVESVSVPVIASLNATTREGWTDLASVLEAAGAAALELNVLEIPADSNKTSSTVERRVIDIVKDVHSAVRIPIAVKLGHCFTAPIHLAHSLADAGADGVVLFNRFYEPDIDLETMTCRPSLALSTRKDIRPRIMWIGLLAGQTRLGLAGTGGVEGVDEVVKYLLAGADVVQTASALLRHGPQQLDRLVKGLAEWLQAHGAASVTEIRGRMSASRLAGRETLLCRQPTPAILLGFPCEER